MKRFLPYIILGVVAIAAVLLLLTGNSDNERKKKFDERITLGKRDKKPYGAYVAYEGLKNLFPQARILSEDKEPGYWDSLSAYESRQALVVISPRFYPDEFEMNKLLSFIEQGNDVFVSTRFLSSSVEKFINSKVSVISVADLLNASGKEIKDSMVVRLVRPPFAEQRSFSYSGLKYTSWFYELDSSQAEKKGYGDLDQINFIQLKAGKGNFYLHLSPLTFSNYFLLHKDNLAYYENVLSVLPADVRKIVWDEYYINKKESYMRNSEDEDSADEDGSLSELFKYPQTKWALLLAIFLLLLYVLMEMRRKQRYIPVINKPKNESLDFVKTIGRLYYERGDHHNLCRKMASYFLEHVRSRYKIPTGQLNEEFIQKLKFKSGVDEEEIRGIVTFIKKLDSSSAISAKEAADFHKQLENFYQKA